MTILNFKDEFSKYVELVNESGQEAKAKCPFHPHDDVPSLSINLQSGLWHCFGCGAGGNFKQFLDKIEKVRKKTVPPEEVEESHEILLKNKSAYSYLVDKRGISPEIIEEFKIGFDNCRFWFPIKDEEGDYINVRKYRPNDAQKTIGYGAGYNKNTLYPISALNDNPIYIMEGETDMLLARSLGLNAVTQTAGAQSWSKSFNSLFTGKDVVIVYDFDDAGRKGAREVLSNLKPYVNTIKIVELPLLNDKEDFSDYILKYKYTLKDFMALVSDAQNLKEDIKIKTVNNDDDTIYEVTLQEASKAEYYNKFVRASVLVTGKDLAPYIIPLRVKMFCTPRTAKCASCPLFRNGGVLEFEIDPYDPFVLSIMGASDSQVQILLKRKVGIGFCSSVEMEYLKMINAEDLSVIADVDYKDFEETSENEYVVRRVLYIGHGLRSNAKYDIVGRVCANPKNQSATMVIKEATPAQDSIDKFEISNGKVEELKIFAVNNIEKEDVISYERKSLC